MVIVSVIDIIERPIGNVLQENSGSDHLNVKLVLM